MRPNRSNRLKHIVLSLLFSASTAASVAAQTAEEAQRTLETIFTPGSTVWITDARGQEVKTRIVDVSPGVVTTSIGEEIRRFRVDDVTRVRMRKSDSVIDGALIGAGVAVASGLFFCRAMEPWDVCRSNLGPLSRIGALGAGIGIGIDALIRGRKTIYDRRQDSPRLQAAPLVGHGVKGLQVSVSF